MNTLLRLPVALFLGEALALAGCNGESSSDDPTPTDDDEATDEATVEAHIDVVLRRIEANNAQDWDTWQSLHVSGAVRTAPELPGPLVGAKPMREAIEELVVTFPDYHLELVEAFGAEDRLVARIHAKATMLGPMELGETTVPPTGKPFEQDWVAMIRFEGDEIARIDELHDNYGILIQLGLAEAP